MDPLLLNPFLDARDKGIQRASIIMEPKVMDGVSAGTKTYGCVSDGDKGDGGVSDGFESDGWTRRKRTRKICAHGQSRVESQMRAHTTTPEELPGVPGPPGRGHTP